MPEEEVEALLVEATGRRLGIGKIHFYIRKGYEFPVAEMEKEKALRLVKSEVADKTNNFRIAIPVKVQAPVEDVIPHIIPVDEPKKTVVPVKRRPGRKKKA